MNIYFVSNNRRATFFASIYPHHRIRRKNQVFMELNFFNPILYKPSYRVDEGKHANCKSRDKVLKYFLTFLIFQIQILLYFNPNAPPRTQRLFDTLRNNWTFDHRTGPLQRPLQLPSARPRSPIGWELCAI